MSEQAPPGSRRKNGPADLSPGSVEVRLRALGEIAILERDEAARARLAREAPARLEPFPAAVQRRLRELRALCELARHLERGALASQLRPIRPGER